MTVQIINFYFPTMHTAKVKSRDNVEYVLRDKEGNIKPLFQVNAIGAFLVKLGIQVPQQSFISSLFGSWVEKMRLSNLITTTGKAGIAARINGTSSPAAYDYVAIGTGTTAANIADTTLETEITTGGGERAQGTPSVTTTDTTDDTATVVKTFTFSSSFAVTEAGLLNAASSGVLAARQVFSAVNVVSSDTLQVTWNIDVD